MIDGPFSIGADEDRDGTCSVYSVNAGLREVGPGSSYGEVLQVRITFEEVRGDGFPTPSAAEHLHDLEDRIESQLKDVDHSVVVGRFTTADRGRTFCFYTSDVEKLSELLGRCMPPYGGQANDARGGPDPDWVVYRDLLGHAMAGEPDMHLVRRLTVDGIDARRVRTVDHYCYFPTQESASRAVEEAFNDVAAEGPFASDDQWLVTVHLVHTLGFADLAHYRNVLTREVCEPLGGSYDGWGIALGDGVSS
jgi:uncharacterized protein DUF695/regulator of ribonuclease activity B